MTKMVTRADGQVTYVEDAFLDSVVQEGDTVQDMPRLERQEPTTEEIANNLVASENYDARKYLADTDWYVTRKAEKSTAIPSAITTHRDAVRTKQAEMETAITNAADTPALETLYTYTVTDGVQSRPLGELPTLE